MSHFRFIYACNVGDKWGSKCLSPLSLMVFQQKVLESSDLKGCQRKRNRQKKNKEFVTSWMSMKAPWVVNINEIEYLEETVVKLVSCQRETARDNEGNKTTRVRNREATIYLKG